MNISILGAGAWGTALAKLLAEEKNSKNIVRLWGHDPAHLDELRKTFCNERNLPQIKLPTKLKFENDLAHAVAGTDLILVAVPSRAFRDVTKSLANFSGTIVSVTKGIEFSTGLTMCGVLQQTAPAAKFAALTGPTLALEVARGIPTAIVAASEDSATAAAVQKLFHRPAFRVYTCADLRGAELGGALKNVIAIAAGMCDGLGFGDNSKAALVTRGLAEIRRLGAACGAQPETFSGLSGLGDLMVTCFSKLSRNRNFGERLGRGECVETILKNSVSVAEGHPTARAAFELARKNKIEMPIVDEIYAALYEGKHPAAALRDLTAREIKAED